MPGKLVRDKIPQIMIQKGQEPKTRILDNDEYIDELLKKLAEEVEEFRLDKNKEELADVHEVLEAIYKVFGFDIEEIMNIKKLKFDERGGFEDKIFLD
jgi:predicted house-cleaning noncanonical NTP pyrophosphatase (MazG superfamily)